MIRDIDRQLRTLEDETQFAVDQNIGDRKDWSEVKLSSTFHMIIALTTFRIFVGLPLSRDKVWLEATTRYAETLEKFSMAVRSWPAALHWLVAPIYWFNSVRTHQLVFIKMLDPIVYSAKQARKAQAEGVSEKNANTLIEWMLSYYRGREATASEITGAQLTASFAAIHSTENLVEHVLMDLAARPEYLASLREELDENCPDGHLDKLSVAKLWKMDSFIKECQRYNPATTCACRINLFDYKELILHQSTCYACLLRVSNWETGLQFQLVRCLRFQLQPQITVTNMRTRKNLTDSGLPECVGSQEMRVDINWLLQVQMPQALAMALMRVLGGILQAMRLRYSWPTSSGGTISNSKMEKDDRKT